MCRSVAQGLALAGLAVASATCADTTAPADTRTVATVRVDPDSVSIRVGHDLQMTALLLDSVGDTLTGRAVQWASADTGLATVSPTGLVTGRSPGHVDVVATAGTVAGRAFLTVLTPVGWVGPVPDTATLVPSGTLELDVVVRGSTGVLSDRPVIWTSADTAIVTVDADGRLTARTAGATLVTPASEGVTSPNPARVVVSLAGYVALGSGPEADHTCAIDSQGGVRCWGNNFYGQLGNGTTKQDPGVAWTGAMPYPTGVINVGGFIQAAGGGGFTCGLVRAFAGATVGWASCWGTGSDYRLGNASTSDVSSPVFVRFGGLASSMTTGFEHGCLIAEADSLAYCWGETGIGAVPWTSFPSLKFTAASGGYHATCGLLTDSAAYCWGNIVGPGRHDGPFLAVTMGSEHACAIRADSTAVCWGRNDFGQLGDGTTAQRTTPVPVVGANKFTALAGGDRSTCGIAIAGAVLCWGANDHGQLGTAAVGVVCQSLPCRTVPGQVSDPLGVPLAAQRLALGSVHGCVLNADQRVYCWGGNSAGQVGDGTLTDRFMPVQVVGQH